LLFLALSLLLFLASFGSTSSAFECQTRLSRRCLRQQGRSLPEAKGSPEPRSVRIHPPSPVRRPVIPQARPTPHSPRAGPTLQAILSYLAALPCFLQDRHCAVAPDCLVG
jgi:hypothetical protein